MKCYAYFCVANHSASHTKACSEIQTVDRKTKCGKRDVTAKSEIYPGLLHLENEITENPTGQSRHAIISAGEVADTLILNKAPAATQGSEVCSVKNPIKIDGQRETVYDGVSSM